jgi:hypothetical protein
MYIERGKRIRRKKNSMAGKGREVERGRHEAD